MEKPVFFDEILMSLKDNGIIEKVMLKAMDKRFFKSHTSINNECIWLCVSSYFMGCAMNIIVSNALSVHTIKGLLFSRL
jgi:hypothetical protein